MKKDKSVSEVLSDRNLRALKENTEELKKLQTKPITVEEMVQKFAELFSDYDLNNQPLMKKQVTDLITQAQATAREEERERITNILDNWTKWTCHTRAEHEQNDCPGWSHEDQSIRETVISQVKEQILQTLNNKTDV